MKTKFTSIITLLILLNFKPALAQNDWFVNKTNDTIKCQILELSAKSIKYQINEKSNKEKIVNLKNLYINDLSIIENPLDINIQEPEAGYANVYFYRTYKYTGSALSCKIMHNDKKLINLKTKSYYIHKIKANETHTYNWINNKTDVIEINAKEGESYFIKGGFGAYSGFDKIINVSNQMRIVLDNPNTAKYSVQRMKKKSKEY